MKTMRVITLPNRKQCTLGTYVASWRGLRKLDPRARVGGFHYEREPAGQVLAEMSAAVHDRINQKDPNYGRGRKWDSDYQVRLWRDSRRLQDMAKRIRVYQFETNEAQSRFADRLSRYDD